MMEMEMRREGRKEEEVGGLLGRIIVGLLTTKRIRTLGAAHENL
jgi:hypothetical protein